MGNMERDGWGGGMESRPRMGRKDEGGGYRSVLHFPVSTLSLLTIV